MSSRSSQPTGNDTGTPGRTRGLYAAITVAPPTRVESTNTFPPRSSFTNAVVATEGSRLAARAAMARVAAADSSGDGRSSIGTNTCSPFAPLVLIAPSSPTSASACRTRWADRTAIGKASGSGGSRSSTRWVMRSGRSARTRVGWYSTARWLANHSSVRRSLHSAYDTSRFEVSAQSRTVQTHGGVYFGTFFCMKASCPRWTRITDSGRSRSSGMMRSRTASRYSTRSLLVAPAPSNRGWSRLVSDTPSRDSSPLVPLMSARR